MEHEITNSAILIKNDALLPGKLYLEIEPCLPGWKLVTNLDASALDRQVRKTGWTFFCLAGKTKASVFGIDHTKMVRRAIEEVLASNPSGSFNSLEILEMKFVGSARFPLVQYLTLSAQWRHIQQGIVPSPARDASNLYFLQHGDVCSKDVPRVPSPQTRRGQHEQNRASNALL